MIIFLDETEFIDLDCSFNIIVETEFLESLFLENVDFIDTKFNLNDFGDFEIIKSRSSNTVSSLKLKQIKNINKIYEISWQNQKTLINDFTTYCYIEDFEKFSKNKSHFEKYLNVKFSDIKIADTSKVSQHKFSSFEDCVLRIISLQQNVKAPSFMYYLFEDILPKKQIETLRNIFFIEKIL